MELVTLALLAAIWAAWGLCKAGTALENSLATKARKPVHGSHSRRRRLH